MGITQEGTEARQLGDLIQTAQVVNDWAKQSMPGPDLNHQLLTCLPDPIVYKNASFSYYALPKDDVWHFVSKYWCTGTT